MSLLRKTAFLGLLSGAMSLIYSATYNYGEALQKSIYFFECQQAGELPEWNRVEWRGPSCLKDGSDVGKDLTGGWFDAGDHVKFNFPMAFTTTFLCLGVKEYRDAYEKSGQLTHILNNIRFVCDYFIKCHTAPNELYGQVGDGGLDHSFWGPAESVEAHMRRPSAKISESKPGSELAAETAAALAAASIIFKPTDPTYAATLLTHAKQLYDFADKFRGKYDAAIPGASGFYSSHSGYNDEIVWGAVWLYMATDDKAYLDKAETEYANLSTEPQMTIKSYKWTIAWDDKSYGCYVLLAKLTGKDAYKEDAQRWLDYWSVGYEGNKITYTPGGLAWLDSWGANRYASNTALMAFIYSDFIEDATLKARYHDFAVKQINYTLGDNPLKRSFVVGFGTNPPLRVHHRTTEGWYPGSSADTIASRHILYGALAGGPGNKDDYKDARDNYVNNEVACDYNAGFTGALARLYQEFGGDPLANFPEKEPAHEQFYVMASVNASGDRFTEIKATLYNKTITPARLCTDLSYRYFVDLSEAISAGIAVDQITVKTNYIAGKAKVSGLKLYDGSVYYVEVSYIGDTLYPGTQDSDKREAQFRIELPSSAASTSWNPSNDWSYKIMGTSGNAAAKALNIPIYDNGVQVWGAEPNKDPVNTIGLKPAARSIQKIGPQFHFTGRKISFSNMNEQASISIINAAGKVVYTGIVSSNAFVDVNRLGTGVYICKLSTSSGSHAINRFRIVE
ncbi:MAG: T9SS type A sorting domain-containing protein [Fibrobacter sp.]|nr:T9SS type A sorting domain-containing protein [Fibrobacter sp.]